MAKRNQKAKRKVLRSKQAPTRRSMLKGAALWAADKAAGGVVGAATFGAVQKLVTAPAPTRIAATTATSLAAMVPIEVVWSVENVQPCTSSPAAAGSPAAE